VKLDSMSMLLGIDGMECLTSYHSISFEPLLRPEYNSLEVPGVRYPTSTQTEPLQESGAGAKPGEELYGMLSL
jgi:hypothetical protein